MASGHNKHHFSIPNRMVTPSNNFNIHIDSNTPHKIIFQFPDTSNGLSSPLYLPLSSKGFQLFRDSPRVQLNFNNGGDLNAHFYGN